MSSGAGPQGSAHPVSPRQPPHARGPTSPGTGSSSSSTSIGALPAPTASTSAAPARATRQSTRQHSQSADAAAGPSTGARSKRSGGEGAGGSGSSGTTLESIDAVCNAIHTIASTGGDPNTQLSLVRESLLPALEHLEAHGNSAGLPGRTVLQSKLQNEADPLELLGQHPLTGGGLGYLYILVSRCQVEGANAELLVHHISRFCEVADPRELNLVPIKVYALALWLQHFCIKAPQITIPILLNLLGKVVGSCVNHLTQLHSMILYQSLRAGSYSTALNLLINYPVEEIDARAFPLTFQDNLKYHLYGGTVFATVERYEEAAELLQIAVTAPAHSGATSPLQIEAYKRLLLVELLKDGKTSPLPKYTSTHLQQTFKQTCATPYLDFVALYEGLASRPTSRSAPHQRTQLVALINEHHRTFVQDQNWGLVQACLEELPGKMMMGLQKIYKSLDLDDAVSLVGLSSNISASGDDQSSEPPTAEAGTQIMRTLGPQFEDIQQAKAYVEATVQRLAASSSVQPRIDSSTADPSRRFLTFSPQALTSQQTLTRLQETLASLSASQDKIKNFDARLSSSKDFLSKVHHQASSRAGAGGGPGTGFGGGFDSIPDEDVMGGRGGAGHGFWGE